MAKRRIQGAASPVYLDVSAGDAPLPVTGDAAALTELQRRVVVLGTANPAAAQTNVLLAQPAAGMRFAVTSLLVSTDTAMNITLMSGGNVIAGPIYLPANGSGNILYVDPLQLGRNHGLRYTSSADGNHSVTAYGWQE